MNSAVATSEQSFEGLIEPHRGALQAHCYRMLGSVTDAEDAVQETLLRAWRGLPGFEGRSSLRSWLYRIATNVCLRMIERRPKRVLPVDHGPPGHPHADPGPPLAESVWIEPYPDDALPAEAGPEPPDARYEQREAIELAFIAALQHLPARQRAVLLLRDVLGFAPREIATTLDTTPASVSSALQRAHEAVAKRVPPRSQQATLRSIGDGRLRAVVERYVRAWEAGDVEAVKAMLAEDVTLSMPPGATWFRGRTDVAAFLAGGPLAPTFERCPNRWVYVPLRTNGQVAFGAYGSCDGGDRYPAHCIHTLTFGDDARVTEITAFLQPELLTRFGLPDEIEPQPAD